MEDVTDTVFREIVLSVSDPNRLHLLYTEFTNVDGMNHPVGKQSVGQRLLVSPTERALLSKTGVKLIAQVWGSDPEVFFKVVRGIAESGDFDGIDINMGCPDKNVVKAGACSALIGQPTLAKEIILATKEATTLPVSVKTRTGIRQHETERWMTNLLETHPAAIILHGRTQKQQSDGLADWTQIQLARILRDEQAPDTAIFGNGDVSNYEDGLAKAAQYQLDGIMVGRGIFHNPWFFAADPGSKSIVEKYELMNRHILLFKSQWEGKKSIYTLKHSPKINLKHFPNDTETRHQLMQAKSMPELLKISQLHN